VSSPGPPPSRQRAKRGLLLAVLLVCLFSRGAYALYAVHAHPQRTVEGDTRSYTEPARALLEDHRFSRAPDDAQPEFVRTPGYPAFLAVTYRLFGESSTAVLLVQVALSTLTVLVVYRLAARMWSVSTALIAAVITTLEPLQNFSAGRMTTESLEALLLVVIAAVGFRVLGEEKPGLRRLALLGLAIAAATMVRPVTYYLPLLVVALLIGRTLRARSSRRDLARMLAALLAPLLVIVGGWQLRNHVQVDSWRFSAVEAKNLYRYRAAGVVAHEEGVSLERAQRRLDDRFGEIGDEEQGPYYARMYGDGVDIWTSEPAAAVQLTARGLFSEVMGVRVKAFGYVGSQPATGALELAAGALLVGFYLVFGYGLALVVRERRHLLAHGFVLAVAAYVLLASAGPEAFGGRGERFRAPVMPLLILYAARGVQQLVVRRRGDVPLSLSTTPE